MLATKAWATPTASSSGAFSISWMMRLPITTRVGHRRDGLGGGGVADAEAHADRQLHMLADMLRGGALTSSMSMLPAPVTPLSDT